MGPTTNYLDVGSGTLVARVCNTVPMKEKLLSGLQLSEYDTDVPDGNYSRARLFADVDSLDMDRYPSVIYVSRIYLVTGLRSVF